MGYEGFCSFLGKPSLGGGPQRFRPDLKTCTYLDCKEEEEEKKIKKSQEKNPNL